MTLIQWFRSLEKREQVLLAVGSVAIVFYLVYGVMYRGLVDSRDRYQRLNAEQQENLAWVRSTAPVIEAMHRSTARVETGDKSLAQLAEEAAKDAGVRISRFQPVNETEAQVWLEQEDFSVVIAFLNRIETDFGLRLEDVSITSANTPGIVNVRVKFAK